MVVKAITVQPYRLVSRGLMIFPLEITIFNPFGESALQFHPVTERPGPQCPACLSSLRRPVRTPREDHSLFIRMTSTGISCRTIRHGICGCLMVGRHDTRNSTPREDT